MTKIRHQPTWYLRDGAFVVGPSVEVPAGVEAVTVERVGWERADGGVVWLPDGPHPRPDLPRRLEHHDSVRWMATTAEIAAAAGAPNPDALEVVPVAMIDGALVRADASLTLDSPTGGRPLDMPPPTPVVEGPLGDLVDHERSVTSQNGEDGVLAAIFESIGVTNRHLVEFGCGDAVECNTAQLVAAGWTGLLMDPFSTSANPAVEIRREFVTAENAETVFDRYGVPASPDLLSIDIDGNDLWVWQAIERRARVVAIEVNSHISPLRARTVAYDPEFRWDGTDQFGASLLALARLAQRKGYTLVHVENRGVNAFFVADECLPAGHVPRSVEELYRRPDFLGLGLAFPSAPTSSMVDPFADGVS